MGVRLPKPDDRGVYLFPDNSKVIQSRGYELWIAVDKDGKSDENVVYLSPDGAALWLKSIGQGPASMAEAGGHQHQWVILAHSKWEWCDRCGAVKNTSPEGGKVTLPAARLGDLASTPGGESGEGSSQG